MTAEPKPPRAPRATLDSVLSAAGIFVVAVLVGTCYCRAFERLHPAPEPWVRELGAAAAFACGHGLRDPGYAPSAAFAAFLGKQTDTLKCTDLPNTSEFHPLNFTQRLYRYMTIAVGLTWKAFGISWSSLAVLLGLLYGCTALAVYGLFCLAVGRFAAVIGTAIMMCSPLQLRYLPQLRDYAKAPFLLMLLLILSTFATRALPARKVLLLAGAYGALTGIGFGFRNDLLIALAPFLVTVVFFSTVSLAVKSGALALCASAFAISALPILVGYQAGSNSGHVAVLGLMTDFDAPLGVERSVYDWGAPYDDGLVVKMVTDFSERVHHEVVAPLSPAYDRNAVDLLLTVARHWPADMLMRAYASTARILEVPFEIRRYTSAAPPGVTNGFLGDVYDRWVATIAHADGLGLILAVACLIAIGCVDVRLTFWLVGMLLYFGGYPAVQFDVRHFFFLEFLGWMVIIAAAWHALQYVRRGRLRLQLASLQRVALWRRVAVCATCFLVAVVAPLITLRLYQQRHLQTLLQRYVELPTQNLTLDPVALHDGLVLLQPRELSHRVEPKLRAEYLLLNVSGRGCPRSRVGVTFRSVVAQGYTDLSRRFEVPTVDGNVPTRVLSPVYYSPGEFFAGVEIDGADRACIESLQRVTTTADTPLLLNLVLPPDWRAHRLYQSLAMRPSRLWSLG